MKEPKHNKWKKRTTVRSHNHKISEYQRGVYQKKHAREIKYKGRIKTFLRHTRT